MPNNWHLFRTRGHTLISPLHAYFLPYTVQHMGRDIRTAILNRGEGEIIAVEEPGFSKCREDLRHTLAYPFLLERIKESKAFGKEWIAWCRRDLTPSTIPLFYEKYMAFSLINVRYWMFADSPTEKPVKGLEESYASRFTNRLAAAVEGRDLPATFSEFRRKNPKAAASVEQLHEEFFWIPYDYYGPRVWGIEEVYAQARDAKPMKKNKDHLLTEQEKIAAALVTLQDLKKEITTQAHYYYGKMLESIAEKTGIPHRDFYYLLPEEIMRSDRSMLPLITARRHSSVTDINQGKVVINTENLESEYPVFFSAAKKIGALQGMIANKGKIRGPAKVVRSSVDIGKVKRGDILIAPMTTPDYIIGLRKAAAIVTDEGGITSHAAIVSRELGIPCVIGTKHATTVFKDRDIIEVDAEKGVVRKVEE